jgi:methyl-accepting chemotaxis protein
MEKQLKQRKLKNYLFANKAQLIIGISNLVLLLLVVGVVIIAVLSPFYSDIFQSGDLYAQHMSSKIFLMLLERCAMAFVLLLLIVFLYQVLIIHKICGPLVSFKNTIGKINSGDLTSKIHLRPYDFFKQEASLVNETLDTMSALVSNVRKRQQKIIETLPRVPVALGRGDEIEEILATIAEQARGTNDELSKLTVIHHPNRDE